MTDTRWTTYAFGIDVSRYQQKLDPTQLKGKIDFLIAKAGQYNWQADAKNLAAHVDSKFADHVSTAAQLGIPCGAYRFFDPTVPQDPINPLADRQIQMLQYALKNKTVHFLSIDVEMYLDPCAKNVTVTNHQISTNSRQFAERVRVLFPSLPIMIYTGSWFVNDYAPDMKAWLDSGHWPIWLAQYPTDPDAPAGIVPANWADFRSKFAPEWPSTKGFPWLSNQPATIWQYSGDKYISSGVYGDVNGIQKSALDLNFFSGTPQDLYHWCNYTPTGSGIIEPTPPPVVIPDPVTPPAARTNRQQIDALLDQLGIK